MDRIVVTIEGDGFLVRAEQKYRFGSAEGEVWDDDTCLSLAISNALHMVERNTSRMSAVLADVVASVVRAMEVEPSKYHGLSLVAPVEQAFICAAEDLACAWDKHDVTRDASTKAAPAADTGPTPGESGAPSTNPR